MQIVFDRVCDELRLGDIHNDPRQRDKLAIIILVRAKSDGSEGEMVEAALSAMRARVGPR